MNRGTDDGLSLANLLDTFSTSGHLTRAGQLELLILSFFLFFEHGLHLFDSCIAIESIEYIASFLESPEPTHVSVNIILRGL